MRKRGRCEGWGGRRAGDISGGGAGSQGWAGYGVQQGGSFTLQVDSKPETVGDVQPASGPLVVGLLVDMSAQLVGRD